MFFHISHTFLSVPYNERFLIALLNYFVVESAAFNI